MDNFFSNTIYKDTNYITYLNLSENNVSTLDLSVISKFQFLSKLDLSNVNLTLVQLPMKLPPSLTWLSLSQNQFGYKGSSFVDKSISFKHLENCPKLCHLDISGTRLSHFPVDLPKTLKTLNMSYLYIQSTFPSDFDAQFPHLLNLYFNHCAFRDFPLPLPKTLQVLHLIENQIAIVPPELQQSTNLMELNMFENALVSLPPPSTFPTSLCSLKLGLETNFSQDYDLVSMFPNLQHISLSSRDFENNLPRLPPDLKSLDVSSYSTTISNFSAEHLLKSKVQILKFHRGLTSSSIKAIAKYLPLSALCELSISSSHLGDSGASLLAKGLRNNTTMTRLSLDYSSITDATGIANSLTFHPSIQVISLKFNSLGPKNGSAFASLLTKNKTLHTLILTHNSIESGAAYIGTSLAKNSTLKLLDLAGNGISDSAALKIAKGLKQNTSLKTLNLSANSVGLKGARAFVQSIVTNSSLRFLNLNRNKIPGKDGLGLFTVGLAKNTGLTHFGIWDNKIKYRMEDTIRKSWEKQFPYLTWIY